MFFRKRNQIRNLEARNWGLEQQLERQSFAFQLTIPVITTNKGMEEVRFSGSPEAIEALQKHFDMQYKKRKPKRGSKGGRDV